MDECKVEATQRCFRCSAHGLALGRKGISHPSPIVRLSRHQNPLPTHHLVPVARKPRPTTAHQSQADCSISIRPLALSHPYACSFPQKRSLKVSTYEVPNQIG